MGALLQSSFESSPLIQMAQLPSQHDNVLLSLANEPSFDSDASEQGTN